MHTFRRLADDGEGGQKVERFGLYWEGGEELSGKDDERVVAEILRREDLIQNLVRGDKVRVFWFSKRFPNKMRVEARLLEYQ